MAKGLFIGLGGTGIKTVAWLKAYLYQRAYGSNKDNMESDCTFLFYDTDSGARDEMMANPDIRKMMGNNPVIDNARGEFIDAGDTAPYNLYKNASRGSVSEGHYKRLIEWAIDPDIPGHFSLDKKQLREGAGAQRMEGRTAVFSCAEEFETRILNCLDGMKQIAETKNGKPNAEDAAIWVFGSSNGGTSSSALLDVLYLIDRLYKTHVSNNNPYLRLVLYMPKPFIDANSKNTESYALNAYATLWELNAFRFDCINKNAGNKFGSFAMRPDKTEWKDRNPWPVYSYVMAVDTESRNNRKVSLDQLYPTTAELCYFLHTSVAGNSMVSNLDNDLKLNTPLANNPKESAIDSFKWTKSLIGIGYKAITKADDYLKEYVRTRLRYDLYGYGLMGIEFAKVHMSGSERDEVTKKFAEDYILCHLASINKLENSEGNSIYKRYLNRFSELPIPSEEDTPSGDEWTNAGSNFTTECDRIASEIEKTFEDPSKDYSMEWVIRQIEKSVCQGVDRNIVNFGLNYTFELLRRVDDEYCEKTVRTALRSKAKEDLKSIKDEIDTIIESNKPRKGMPLLVEQLKKYKETCLINMVVDHAIKIIDAITIERSGLLEYMRKGDRTNYSGIKGLIDAFNGMHGTSKTDYQMLVSRFSKTETEACSDYFPKVSEFVKGESWVKNNLFEQLYASVVPLNYDATAVAFDNADDYGCPPIRKNDDGKGLATIIEEIKAMVSGGQYLFADMALSNPQTKFNDLMNRFNKAIDEFIEKVFLDGSNQVKSWLDMPLSKVFDQYFISNGKTDENKRTEYVNTFTASIPVFYPTGTGTDLSSVQTRYLYVGATEEFAETMGYEKGDKTGKQYKSDTTIGNRFLVCKIEVGHNFFDYKYFPFISNYYYNAKKEIENLAKGCHIHKAFVLRDIDRSFNELKANKFYDFISLCWYDSFFEALNSSPNQSYIQALFGRSFTGMGGMGAMGGMQPGGNQMQGGMGMMGGMQPGGNQMQGGMGMFGGGFNPNGGIGNTNSQDVQFGYTPIVEIKLLGQNIDVKFAKITLLNNLGYVMNGEKHLPIQASSLSDIWLKLVNYDEINYAEDYFSIIKKQFDKLANQTKSEIQYLYSQECMNYDLWNRFVAKVNCFSNVFTGYTDDNEVWNSALRVVNTLVNSNIFYN